MSYIEIREGTWKDRHLYDYQYVNVLYTKNEYYSHKNTNIIYYENWQVNQFSSSSVLEWLWYLSLPMRRMTRCVMHLIKRHYISVMHFKCRKTFLNLLFAKSLCKCSRLIRAESRECLSSAKDVSKHQDINENCRKSKPPYTSSGKRPLKHKEITAVGVFPLKIPSGIVYKYFESDLSEVWWSWVLSLPMYLSFLVGFTCAIIS